MEYRLLVKFEATVAKLNEITPNYSVKVGFSARFKPLNSDYLSRCYVI